ncbi:hypothetical protein BSZ22_36610 [Bradyrhizobium canariense]|jgi:hypothetical protein|nr:hypothetical protein BSZ21_32750 [Bradyrhizobium canariense]OSI63094.1 hypothetical protein BSZ22_36610 [Bradyrhizobium canariense]OSI72532.1 hypothetical protein BSZ23_36940 [Bradyrhizobium canariense]OSI83503.1 hypothetical protein BSZ25_36660 [Bradyrhizobium canariense]
MSSLHVTHLSTPRLTRINTLSLERGLGLRRMVIAKMQEPPDVLGYRARLELYNEKGAEVESEAQAARTLINSIIEDTSTPSDNAALARIDNRIENLDDTRRQLKQETRELLSHLEARDFPAARRSLARADAVRDDWMRRSVLFD